MLESTLLGVRLRLAGEWLRPRNPVSSVLRTGDVVRLDPLLRIVGGAGPSFRVGRFGFDVLGWSTR